MRFGRIVGWVAAAVLLLGVVAAVIYFLGDVGSGLGN
jgi:hypothetical protein